MDQIPLIEHGAHRRTATDSDSPRPLDNVLCIRRTPSAVGKPSRKPFIHGLDIAALVVAVVCGAAAIATVQNDFLSWSLRLENQLIVLGVLLSIMNKCLTRTTTFLLLHLEARFGRSTIQNYDGILLNQFLRARLDFIWRIMLVFFLVLPLGLSVAYKRFTGGSSTVSINATDITGIAPQYGLFKVSNMSYVYDDEARLTLYFNATAPFRSASGLTKTTPPSCSANCLYIPTEPPLPQFPQAYGANTLLIDESSTAMLDMPSHDRLQILEDSLSIGDSLTIDADVYGTVAQYNNTSAPTEDPLFIDRSKEDSWQYSMVDMYDGYRIGLFSQANTGDQSHIWIGIIPVTDNGFNVSIEYFALYARRYDISRRTCHGLWSITRGGIGLLQGSCGEILAGEQSQSILTENDFMLNNFYLPVLADSIGGFAGTRTKSAWLVPSINTMVSGMIWSSMTSLSSLDRFANLNTDLVYSMASGKNMTIGEWGIFYEASETVKSLRITLQKSFWLYFVLAIQPLMMMIAMTITIVLYSTPLDRGFGIISILAGIDRHTLDILQGSSLSGELKKDIRLNIATVNIGNNAALRYQLSLADKQCSNGSVNSAATYS